MTVYGEEHIPVDISNGLFLSNTPDTIPDGYCQELVNMLRTSKGTWAKRNGFANSRVSPGYVVDPPILYTFDYTPFPSSSTFGKTLCGSLYGGSYIPQLWAIYFNTALNQWRIIAGSDKVDPVNDIAFTDQGYSAVASTVFPLDMAQYKDRVYALQIPIASANAEVVRITPDFVPPISPLLSGTVVISSTIAIPAVSTFNYDYSAGIVSYQNRLFIFRGNRLTWTDLPTAGGYPETWNNGANFLSLPADNTGSPTIYKCIPLNGLLYIFTDKGIFMLNGRNNDPTTWTVTFINQTFIDSRYRVLLVKNVFILVNQYGIYAFNGSSVTQIGEPIQFIFSIYNAFDIYEFLDGFILSCKSFGIFGASTQSWALNVNGPVGANNAVWGITKNYYFDGTTWSELQLNTTNNAENAELPFTVIGGFNNKTDPIQNPKGIAYLYLEAYDPAMNAYKVMIAKYCRSRNQDNISSATFGNIFASLRTKDIIASAANRRAGGSRTLMLNSRIKNAFVRIYSRLPNVAFQWYRNGSLTPITLRTKNTSGTTFTKTLTGVADNNYEIELPGAEYNSRVSLRITNTTTRVPGNDVVLFSSDNPGTASVFEIKDIIIIGNTALRTETEGVST